MRAARQTAHRLQTSAVVHDDHEQLDLELARLGQSLRSGDHMLACLQLADFALRMDHYLRREERALLLARQLLDVTVPRALDTVMHEHARLRELVAAIASALDRSDDQRCIETICKLRSVLLLHAAKKERLLAPPTSHAIH